MTLYAVFTSPYPDLRLQGEPGPPVTLLGIFSTREKADEVAGPDELAWVEEVPLDSVVGRPISD